MRDRPAGEVGDRAVCVLRDAQGARRPVTAFSRPSGGWITAAGGFRVSLDPGSAGLRERALLGDPLGASLGEDLEHHAGEVVDQLGDVGGAASR
jgi:hypothetical protein